MLCFGKVPVAKMFMDKCGGISRFSFDFFSSHSAENFVGESFSLSLI